MGFAALTSKDFKKALTHYQRSYSEVPRPRTMYNIALCEEATGKYQAAVDHYQQFLIEAESRDADFLPLARAKLTALRKRIGAVLRVDSDPPGAAVRINGKLEGHTPLRIDMLEGTHSIRVSRKGSRSSERDIQIRAGENAYETFDLDSLGSISLSVTPSDAKISRLGDDYDATGNYKANLSPGTYDFEVSLEGYRTRTIIIELKAGANIQKRVRLKALSNTGTITLTSDTSGANVTVDGIIVGSMRTREGEDTPSLERSLTTGNHVVIVEAGGNKVWSDRFHLSAGETFAVDLKFRTDSKGRKVARWGLNAAGIASVLAGLTLGGFAIVDVRSDDQDRHDRGKSRAGIADLLIGVGAVSLTGAWYLKGGDDSVTVERSRTTSPRRAALSLQQRPWVDGLSDTTNGQSHFQVDLLVHGMSNYGVGGYHITDLPVLGRNMTNDGAVTLVLDDDGLPYARDGAAVENLSIR